MAAVSVVRVIAAVSDAPAPGPAAGWAAPSSGDRWAATVALDQI